MAAMRMAEQGHGSMTFGKVLVNHQSDEVATRGQLRSAESESGTTRSRHLHPRGLTGKPSAACIEEGVGLNAFTWLRRMPWERSAVRPVLNGGSIAMAPAPFNLRPVPAMARRGLRSEGLRSERWRGTTIGLRPPYLPDHLSTTGRRRQQRRKGSSPRGRVD